jgi:hypothetical protein
MLSVKNNYSDEVFQHQQPLKRKELVFRSLNKPDFNIWFTGFDGLLKLIKKYIIIILRLKSVEIFFDLCILFNFILFALNGFIREDALLYLNNIITIVLGIELVMKLTS